MGLDVIFCKNGESLDWDDPIMRSFPFQAKDIFYPVYDEYEQYVGEESDPWIVEITGMVAHGSISFRGRGYSHFFDQLAEVDYDFYHSFSPEELKEQVGGLGTFLQSVEDQSDEVEVHGEALGRIRSLHMLLTWAVSQGLGTKASF